MLGCHDVAIRSGYHFFRASISSSVTRTYDRRMRRRRKRYSSSRSQGWKPIIRCPGHMFPECIQIPSSTATSSKIIWVLHMVWHLRVTDSHSSESLGTRPFGSSGSQDRRMVYVWEKDISPPAFQFCVLLYLLTPLSCCICYTGSSFFL